MLGKLVTFGAALFLAAVGLAGVGPAATGEVTPRLQSFDVHAMQFNILSSQMAPGGRERARRAAEQVRLRHRNVVAFQEVAADQYRVLHDRLPGYSFYPRRKLGTFSSALQIAWKDRRFRVLETGQIYRPFLGKLRAIPYVELRDRATHGRFFVLSVHNSPGGWEAERDISTRKEIRLVRRLEGRGVGPVMVLGDVNERLEFCQKLAAATAQVSMDGGRTHPCPISPGGRNDWMLGSWRGESFSGFRKIDNHISDHPVVVADVTVRTP
jgi:endonuclease/exonuclease/phosphatase family metal-dependent hydrolase